MTVKELRERLADLPDAFRVIVSRDAEGNGYRPVGHIEAGASDDEGWPDEGDENAVFLYPV